MFGAVGKVIYTCVRLPGSMISRAANRSLLTEAGLAHNLSILPSPFGSRHGAVIVRTAAVLPSLVTLRFCAVRRGVACPGGVLERGVTRISAGFTPGIAARSARASLVTRLCRCRRLKRFEVMPRDVTWNSAPARGILVQILEPTLLARSSNHGHTRPTDSRSAFYA